MQGEDYDDFQSMSHLKNYVADTVPDFAYLTFFQLLITLYRGKTGGGAN